MCNQRFFWEERHMLPGMGAYCHFDYGEKTCTCTYHWMRILYLCHHIGKETKQLLEAGRQFVK